MKDNELIDIGRRVEFDDVGNMLVRRTQEIPDFFLDDLAASREATRSKFTKMGEFVKLCSVPAVIVEKWILEGFNIHDPNVRAEDIVKRLKNEGLDKLMATERKLV